MVFVREAVVLADENTERRAGIVVEQGIELVALCQLGREVGELGHFIADESGECLPDVKGAGAVVLLQIIAIHGSHARRGIVQRMGPGVVERSAESMGHRLAHHRLKRVEIRVCGGLHLVNAGKRLPGADCLAGEG